MKEIWKNIEGYEGHYQISNLGRVKSLRRRINNAKGFFIRDELIMKQSLNLSGYYNLNLTKNAVSRNHRIHRLVAIHFIQNNGNKLEVNHKDGNKKNNHIRS